MECHIHDLRELPGQSFLQDRDRRPNNGKGDLTDVLFQYSEEPHRFPRFSVFVVLIESDLTNSNAVNVGVLGLSVCVTSRSESAAVRPLEPVHPPFPDHRLASCQDSFVPCVRIGPPSPLSRIRVHNSQDSPESVPRQFTTVCNPEHPF
jgi:hypothetical protein